MTRPAAWQVRGRGTAGQDQGPDRATAGRPHARHAASARSPRHPRARRQRAGATRRPLTHAPLPQGEVLLAAATLATTPDGPHRVLDATLGEWYRARVMDGIRSAWGRGA